MAHVAAWKYDEVKEIISLLTSKKVVGIVEIGSIPAPQMQQMRGNLRDVAILRSCKNRLILLALDEADKTVNGMAKLKDLLTGQTAIIATDMNSFKLFSHLKKTRTMAPAKGGETAQKDIEVKAGDTPFKPGPIVGELQKVGIPAAIQEGKVVIKKDKVLVLAGEKISPDIAQMLTRLEIFPIEIGITLHGAFEDGDVFLPSVLDIDPERFAQEVLQASSGAFNLAVELAWVNNVTVKPLIMKAHYQAFSLAVERGILTKETIKPALAKAYQSMLGVAAKCSAEALSEELKKTIT